MRRVFCAFLLVVWASMSVWAQQPATPTAPDYSVRNIRSEFSANQSDVLIAFEVFNEGLAADNETRAELVVVNSGQVLVSQPLGALQATEIVTVRFNLPVSTLAAMGTTVSLRARVNPDEINDSNQGNNIALISISVPAGAGSQAQPIPGIATATPPRLLDGLPTAIPSAPPASTNPLRFLETFDYTNREQLALAIGIGLIVFVLLWLLSLIVRLLFRGNRRVEFGAWQPPYANMPYADPDTRTGRRQQWQMYAQNNAILVPPEEGVYHVRKLLVGVNGLNFSGWELKAVRMNQYDMYGRVARSQVLAPRGLVKRFDRAIHKGQTLNGERVIKSVRPVARGLANPFSKRLNNRNAMLPIALDLRFQGVHGEVRILFELYQCQQGYWQLVDEWEPEMTVMGKALHEQFTFTVYGQRPGETLKEFRARLQDDITAIFNAMIRSKPAEHEMPYPVSPPTSEMPRV